MIILVLNCGSSSLKYQVLDMQDEQEYNLLAKGLVERIGLEMGDITHTVTGREKYKLHKPVANHTDGIKSVLELLTSGEHGVLKSLSDINAVGHRVAHGGEYFSESKKIDASVIDKIEKCCELAPLHNPANLLGIKAVAELMPQTPQVAVFDTSFHQTIPDYAYMYAIPYEYYSKYKIRRYGFHGTSHQFVARKAARLAGLDFEKSRIITCHLGNGSSVTAICNGKSVDTSMGFTPVEGVVMGTRCGNVDAGVVTYIQDKEQLDSKGINAVLNKMSGFLGVSGVSSDARDVEAASATNRRAALTLEMFKYSVLKYVGAYAAVMNGVDLIVFTGGIGENDPAVREYISSRCAYLGVDFDASVNDGLRGRDMILTRPSSRVAVAAVTTNEELVIAQDTMRLAK
ncbi:MAG: acetate kinase [Bacteroidetes bacterium]|uniref:Acetate kinase n=1 Tax=Candidatus Egerieousia excrementavium TaxID=2840778 RepID=A0A9D9DKA1_9BACT|nr:acetate kinase [Candidatus Egerieousia excrementavium]